MVKKLLTLLCLLATVSFFVIPIIASTTSSFVVSSASVERGEVFEVTVSLGKTENVGRIGIIPSYDKNAFEFVSGEWLVDGALSDADISKTGAAIIAFSGTENLSGDVYSFTLRVKETARGGIFQIGGIVDTGTSISVSPASVYVDVQGTSVSGEVISYNPQNEKVVELLQNGCVVYRTVIPANDGDGLVSQNFEITGVAPGEYDLLVTKEVHTAYEIKGITVGNDPLRLTEHENENVSKITLISGDVNGDGCVDLQDVAILTSAATYSKSYEEAASKSADVNGDKCFDLQDLAIITSAGNYGKTKIQIEY